MPPNPFLLAADNSPELLPLLRSDPSLAAQQDEHGYSLLHAAASYDHLDLLRSLVREFRVPVDLADEDGETALFVVETVEAARVLVEELGIDTGIRSGEDGKTASQKIEEEGEWPEVARYLASVQTRKLAGTAGTAGTAGANAQNDADPAAPAHAVALSVIGKTPRVPEGLDISFGTMADSADDDAAHVDPGFRQRIQQLAAREDFHSVAGQAELQRLVEDAVNGTDLTPETGNGSGSGRNVRQRRG